MWQKEKLRNVFVIIYADDILLGPLAPSLTELDNLFRMCKWELNLLDVAINFKKSACIRIGHWMDARCAKISSSSGSTIPCVKDIKYLSVHILQSRRPTFKCSLANHRERFIVQLMLSSVRLVVLHLRK